MGSTFISWSSKRLTAKETQFTFTGNHLVGFHAPASTKLGKMVEANEFNTTYPSKIWGNCARDNNVVGTDTCNGGINVKDETGNGNCETFAYTCGAYPTSPEDFPLPSSDLVVDTADKYVVLQSDKKVLNLSPHDDDVALIDVLTPRAAMNVFEGTVSLTHYNTPGMYEATPPYYEADTGNPLDNGATCFLPSPPTQPEVSWFDMDDAQDANYDAGAYGYKSAVNTSVTGGITLSGWFKAGNTTGIPWGDDVKEGQQTSIIFARGEKASWRMGYNLGMGNWNSFRFQVNLVGPESNQNYPLTVSYPYTELPGIDVWYYVVAV